MVLDVNFLIRIGLCLLLAGVLSFGLTPVVKVLAQKMGAMDVPKDDRRMHTVPIPRMGGLAIFLAFLLAVVVFTRNMDRSMQSILLGSIVIVILEGISIRLLLYIVLINVYFNPGRCIYIYFKICSRYKRCDKCNRLSSLAFAYELLAGQLNELACELGSAVSNLNYSRLIDLVAVHRSFAGSYCKIIYSGLGQLPNIILFNQLCEVLVLIELCII